MRLRCLKPALIWVFVLGGILVLGACVSAPPRPEAQARPSLPSAFGAEESEAAAAHAPAVDWWSEVGGDELDALIVEAIAHNYDLQAAARRVVASAALARQSGALLDPTLDFRLDAARNQNVFVGLPIPGTNNVLRNTTDTFLGGLALNWEADLWGRLAAQERVDLAGLAAAQAERADVALSLAGQTASRWLALIEARLQRELAERSLANFQESERNIGVRYRSGLANALDLRLAETQSAAEAAALADAKRVERSAQRALELLLGRYPAAEVQATGSLPELPDLVPAGLPVDLLTRRPDLVAAEHRLLALESGSAALRADLYPRLVLTASYGRTSDELSDLLDGDFSIWGLAAGLVQPLLDGGRRRAGIEASDGRWLEAQSQFAASVLQACAEVEQALDSERYLREQVGHLQVAKASSAAAEELSSVQYNEGLVTIVNLLEAQRAHLDAESNLLRLHTAALQARVNLMTALGGGYALENEQETRETGR